MTTNTTEVTVASLAKLVVTATDLFLEGVFSRREMARHIKIVFDRAEALGFAKADLEAEITRQTK